MFELYEAVNSIYCYPDSNVLVNKLNIHDNKKLATVERKLVLLKLYTLRQNNNIGKFDIHHFLSIHKFLFEDIYPFAGKIRSEDIAKDSFRFAKWEYIEDQLNDILNKLAKDNLKNLNKEDMSKKLAYYMSELNVLHPFREGNGRTIREFIRELAYVNGYSLDIKNVVPKEMFNACIESVVNTEHLENVILKCLEKI